VVFDNILKASREPQKVADLFGELPQSKKREETFAEMVCRPRPFASVGLCLAPPRTWRFQVSRTVWRGMQSNPFVSH